MPAKKYRVELTPDQRDHLFERIGRGERPARELTRARVLLKVDEGPEGPAWTDKRTAEALEVAEGTVQSLRERFCGRGLKGTVERKTPDREYETKLDGEQEAELIRLACSKAPEGRSDWSLRLLADKMIELGVVGSISHEAVRQTLKKRTEAASEAPMGHSPRTERPIRGEDGGCALCLQASLRPGPAGGLPRRDASAASERSSGADPARARTRGAL